jgi:hypothetical protein
MDGACDRHHARWKKGEAHYHEGRSDQAEEDARLVRALLDEDSQHEQGGEKAALLSAPSK